MRYSEYHTVSVQNLRDSAARFKKETDINNLILVRKKPNRNLNEEEEGVERDEVLNEDRAENEQVERERENAEQLNDEDRELELLFVRQLEQLNRSTMVEIETRPKLTKIDLTVQLLKVLAGSLNFTLKG